MGHSLKNKTIRQPARIYAALECVIGAAGLFLGAAFSAIEHLDTWIYHIMPQHAALGHLIGITVALSLPTMAMGATLPVLGLIARPLRTSIAVLYGLNTLGAAIGALLTAFFLIPLLGITHAIWIVSSVNFIAGILAWNIKSEVSVAEKVQEKTNPPQPLLPMRLAIIAVCVTGFATFVLEVAWFRSLTAAFMSTTGAFAIMLSCVLTALGLGATFAVGFKRKKAPLGAILAWSGILILIATPVIERFDLFIPRTAYVPAALFVEWFFITLYVIGAPIFLLGIALPWILDEQETPKRWGMLYALNALCSIIGALSAGWIFLPLIGFARTAWMAGTMVAVTGLLIAPRDRRFFLGILAITALLTAAVFESGIGKIRVQGASGFVSVLPTKILEEYEGPDTTATAVEYLGGGRALYIDGFVATQQPTEGFMLDHVHYMAWMGHLPMLLHPDPKNTLVICFGVGQTANAVRQENPLSLDIVDLNANIFKLAHNFSSNEDVLHDPRVKTIVMDGRAYMRRTDKVYDVITLEPMPPVFAGVNALYSQEFYQSAKRKLSTHGVIAQWLPFHLVSPNHSASIAKTFQSVFPNAVLWIDPLSKTGILLGSADDHSRLGTNWPGYARRAAKRDLSEQAVRRAIALDSAEVQLYSADGQIITDDNQLLSYGAATYLFYDSKRQAEAVKLLKTAPALKMNEKNY